MNARTRVFTRVLAGAAVATTVLLSTASADAATPSCAVPALDARFLAKADQGAAPLRRFVERTEPIHRVDMDHAVARADRARRVRSACAPTASASR